MDKLSHGPARWDIRTMSRLEPRIGRGAIKLLPLVVRKVSTDLFFAHPGKGLPLSEHLPHQHSVGKHCAQDD